MTERGLQILEWNREGYQPLVFHHDWMVALLNWEPLFDLCRLGEVERHNETDEVFVLLQGEAGIFTIDTQGLQIDDMKQGMVYNVRQGVWHGLLGTRSARWVIIESRDTHLHDCEFRQLNETELASIRSHTPAWLMQE